MERILIKFTKTSGAKFISHLDTLRTLHRTFKRAGVPIVYSKGFNPHPSISVTAPLSLGIGSISEYADVEIEEYIAGKVIKDRLNNTLPQGMKILDVINVKEKLPASMGLVEGAAYNITLEHCTDESFIEKEIETILLMDSIIKNKKSKSGEKLVNIRPLIEKIEITDFTEKEVTLLCLIRTGSRASLASDMVAELIKEYSMGKIFGYPRIVRRELYTIKNEKWIGMASYFSGK